MVLSNKRVALEVVTFTALLFLVTALSCLSLEKVSIPSYGTIEYGYGYIVYQNGTNTQYRDSKGTLKGSNPDDDVIINAAINDANNDGGGTVYLMAGDLFQINSILNMRSDVTLILGNNSEIRAIANQEPHILFDRINDAHIIGQGKPLINFNSKSGYGIQIIGCSRCSLEHLELKNSNDRTVDIDNSNDNFFFDLYCHGYGKTVGEHCWCLDRSSRNRFLDCIIDGSDGGSNCRSGICIGGMAGPSYDNEIIGGEIKNSKTVNGIYLGGWEYPVERTRIIGVKTSGNTASGHCGIKFRPSSYNVVEDWISEGDYNGMEVGTCDDSDPAATGSVGNNVSGTIINPLNVGLILYIDGTGGNRVVANNIFSLNITGAEVSSVWIANPETTNIENNKFYLISTGSTGDGIFLNPSTAGATGLIRRNYFKGISVNNVGYDIRLTGDSPLTRLVDNSFDMITDGQINDGGSRTRINRLGKQAAGVGNPPTAALWDIGDIVINTNDNTAWIKDVDGIMKLLAVGEPLARFEYMNGMGGLGPQEVQFIDQSFVKDYNIISWDWDFGDGGSSSDQNPLCTYSVGGDYTVSLTVTAGNGKTNMTTELVSVPA